MDSIKTKTNNYSLVRGKAIAGVVLVPKDGCFIGYVAWEWEDQANMKFFAIAESKQLIHHFDSQCINNIADYGNDVTHKKEAQYLFPHLFELSYLKNQLPEFKMYSGDDWVKFLFEQPQYAEHCDWELLNGMNWVKLLQKHPQFNVYCNWDKLNGWEWVILLKKRSQFARYCNWEKLKQNNWRKLLSNQPQFADKCDWNLMNEPDVHGGNFELELLLSAQPQFIKYKK